MTDDERRELTMPDHRAFARALVALAREHGMSHLHVTYSASASARFLRNDGTWSCSPVTMTWCEGRHGSEERISLEYKASTVFPEQDSEPK